MKHIFSIPNQITYIRILLIPVFIMFLLLDIPHRDYIAAFIFIILSISDAFDGYIARKRQQVSGIGKILDPIADKLLTSTALIFLIGRIPLWMVIVIIARELIITTARIFFLPKKVVISASKFGKIKTIIQIVAIVAVIINFPFNWWFMFIALIVTVVSGFDYLIKMAKIMDEDVVNIPNIITTIRLLLIPLYVINLMNLRIDYALIIFTIIILMDKLDGVFSRKTGHVTRFGRTFDVITDYILILMSFIVFLILDKITIFWGILLGIPVLIISITRIILYRMLREKFSRPFGKLIIFIGYVTIISIMVNYIYNTQILLTYSILLYTFMMNDIFNVFAKRINN